MAFLLDLHLKTVAFTVLNKTFIFYIIGTVFSTQLVCQNLQLNINGKNDTETAIIDSLGYNKNHNDFLSIKQEIDSLQKMLYTLGYIENELQHIKKTNDSVFSARYTLKNKYQTIYIYYDKTIIDTKLLSNISDEITASYFKLEFSNIESTLNRLNSNLAENGHPFSKLQLQNISIKNATSLTAQLIITQNQTQRTIDHIIIKGYNKFPVSYLKHYLKIKTGQTFNLNTIKEKTSQLNHLRFANEIKSPEVLFLKDSTSLYLYLEKRKSNAFDGFLGFGTNENTNQLEFDGYLNLNLTNNLNYGESLKLLYKSDENEQKTFEAHASLPYVFKSPIGLDVLLRIFKKDSSFTTVNQAAKLHYQINPKHKIFAGLTNKTSNSLLSNNSSSTLLDYNTNYYTIAYEYTKHQTQNLLFPINTYCYLETNFGKRQQSNSIEKQTLLNLRAFKIISISPKNSIFIKLDGGILNSNSYLINELMRFGGINSIRGFEENSIYASLYNVLNTEYRYQLSNNIYIHSITDFSHYQNKITNTREKLYGFGFGFGILTKAGLLKFNYANGKNKNTAFKLSNSKIHLSLTSNF